MAVEARRGILGGVFDPPHVGHVALAQAAIEQLELEQLLVLVVADPGHKSATTAAGTRLELTRLAGTRRVEPEFVGRAYGGSPLAIGRQSGSPPFAEC